MSTINKVGRFGICDVQRLYNFYFKWLLGKLHTLFKWENLPHTIDEISLNTQLFLNGMTCFCKVNDKLYCLFGNVGGEVNEYYRPQFYIVANPVLGSHTFKILGEDKDAICMYNTNSDYFFQFLPLVNEGLSQLIRTTATMLADNMVSINTSQINTRASVVFTAETEAERQSAEYYLERLYSGKPYTVVQDTMLNSLHINPLTSSTDSKTLSELVELNQYIIAQFFNAIGVKTNPVRKKERLITDEIESLNTYLDVNVREMLESRQTALKEINEMFNTDIKVSVSDFIQLTNDTDDTENIKDGDSEHDTEKESQGRAESDT